ncbi:hypothetical protein CHLRE_21g752797v5 [Chlamydomonas reinhardtii]|uniref:Uncharacterized protein n=1 Tax=Chlamydomonas reinhardtii TaxID=3055 RepID=A0A2K3CN91_CHLRE|nr:uncharacterized protein CHLRE_21g752347v5 [Chlamydomonas reinhardtii]XP_042914184.1 uncharacterized protein CHLRE_21g752797v5 [Chlamydomonas reinhardtii]PNW69754.1 hypothetical protein CHLRE_21g752347v5 [Chlamydomonas reinhardtii]PNW69762.1 hypothetical protein CHLRE_21g752797v5 [Chlamydomonas reinhardtii]
MELAAGARAWIRLRPAVLAPFSAAGWCQARRWWRAVCLAYAPRPTVLAPFPAAGVKPTGMDGGAS